MPAKGNKHYGCLLDDPQVNRWYENVARGSRITSDAHLTTFVARGQPPRVIQG